MAAPVLQFKRGLLANLPGLRAGEPGFTTDSYDLYVGVDSSTTNNKFFGSHRYWTRGTATTGSGVNLVEGTNNGTQYITLKAPDSLSGIGTYTFPDTSTITPGYFLKVGAGGTLSWDTVTASGSFSNATLTGNTTITGSLDNQASTTNSGITTFTNATDNTLGNADTGAVQIDGGLGINKNVTIGQNLHVAGYSNFVGVVTFQGGTINLGDSNTDNINVTGEFISNLTPNTDNTYDLGIGTQRWRSANFAGVVTATTFSGSLTGTASTATRATTVDVTAAPNGVYYPTFVNTPSTSTGNTLYSDAGLYYISQTDTLYINGNVSIGGTTGVLFATNLFVNDKDIVVGYTTDVNGNDVSRDSTSTHGGIAVASTTGSPLFNMPQVAGVNSLPFTYKQFMWVAQGTSGYSGMGTDAWLSNYAIGIGTATVANNSRLTVGAGFTVFDTFIDANSIDLRVRSINATGVTTFTNNVSMNGNVTLGDAAGDTITINGTATFAQGLSGTISTATRATLVDTTTAPAGTFYPGLFVNSTGTASTAVYVDAGISYVSNTDTLTLTGDIAVNGGDVTTSAGTFNLVNGTATNVNFAGAASALNMGANTGIATINNPTVTLPNATTINVNGANPTFASSSTGSLTFFNNNITSVNEFGAATSIVMGATTGITTVRNKLTVGGNLEVDGNNIQSSTGANVITLSGSDASVAGILTVTGSTLNVNGANPTLASSSTGTLSLFNSNISVVNAFQGAGNIVLGATSGITTVRNSLRVTSNLYDSTNSAGTSGQFLVVTASGIGWTTVSGVSAGTISTAARANTVDIAATNAQTGGILFGTAGNGAQVYNDADLTYDSNTNRLTAVNITASTEVRTAAVRAADGTSAISITNATGAVQTNSDFTVGGNLFVNGSTTQVNTSELQVYDRTITLGIQSGTTASTTTWDLGVLMNYGDAGIAKTAGVIWESANKRFQFSASSNNAVGINTDTPQLSVTTFAPIEVAEIWVNNTCSGGSSRIVGCTGGTLILENITVDAGTF